MIFQLINFQPSRAGWILQQPVRYWNQSDS